MPRNALLGLAAAVVTALGLTSGALADVVPLQADPLAPASAAADPWAGSAEEADAFADLLSVQAVDEGPAPLLELLGMPAPGRRKAVVYAGASRAVPGERDTARLPPPTALEDADDGVASLGRRALEVFEGLGVAGGPSESYAMRQAAPSEPLAALPPAPVEGQSTWLRDALQLLRGNREWVVLGVAAVVLGMLAMRALSMWSQARPRQAGFGRGAARVPVPSRQGSR